MVGTVTGTVCTSFKLIGYAVLKIKVNIEIDIYIGKIGNQK